MVTQEGQKFKWRKIVVVILATLLVISAGGLAARYIYLHFFTPEQTTVTVPNNLLGEKMDWQAGKTAFAANVENSPAQFSNGSGMEAANGNSGETNSAASVSTQATALELHQSKSGDNEKFEVGNMLPGDSVTKYFCVRAYHDADISLFFRADVTGQTKSLGDVLHIKVTHLDSGQVLCDAPFAEIDGREFSELLAVNAQEETAVYYQIDVSLDTSVGNEYQAARLLADFAWYVEDEGGLTPPPQTGDAFNLAMWVTLAASSLLLILLLAFTRRRKEAEQHG